MPHIHEKIDFVTDVYVVCKNKILLRLHDKYNIWIGVGGHIELDENPNQAAIREVKEEVGLDIDLYNPDKNKIIKNSGYLELVPPNFMNMHNINENHKHISMVYFAISESDEVIPEKSTDKWVWLNKEDLEKMKDKISPEVYKYASKALDLLA